MSALPTLADFDLRVGEDGIAHLVFDVPDRRFNILSERAIADITRLVRWLETADVRGMVIRSGKPNAFCAGSDLNELRDGYDLVAAAPQAQRDGYAFDRFFPLSKALRALESCGKPVAAAVGGAALGGGSELALACHHRVLADDPNAAFGQPEAAVGLAPGAGGTQRLPRLVGVERALPVLLEGERLGGREALDAGLADALVPPGEEVEAAERWVRAAADPRQPWDRPGYRHPDTEAAPRLIARARERLLQGPSAHVPAPFAILECLERGLPQPMDEAVRIEMEVFAGLIQRPEPRNMIRTLFFGKLAHDRAAKAGTRPAGEDAVIAAVRAAIAGVSAAAAQAGAAAEAREKAFGLAGFTSRLEEIEDAAAAPARRPARSARTPLYWFERRQDDRALSLAADFVLASVEAAAAAAPGVDEADMPAIDYALCRTLGYPEYLGGPLNLARQMGLLE